MTKVSAQNNTCPWPQVGHKNPLRRSTHSRHLSGPACVPGAILSKTRLFMLEIAVEHSASFWSIVSIVVYRSSSLDRNPPMTIMKNIRQNKTHKNSVSRLRSQDCTSPQAVAMTCGFDFLKDPMEFIWKKKGKDVILYTAIHWMTWICCRTQTTGVQFIQFKWFGWAKLIVANSY